MRYTIRAGVEHPFSERVNDSSRFILPSLVLLAGVLFLITNPYHATKNARPLTLGIYNVATPDNNSASSSGGSRNDSSGSGAGLSGSTGQTGLSPQSGVSAPPADAGGAAIPSTSSLVGASNPQNGSLSATVTSPAITTTPASVGSGTLNVDPPLPKPPVPLGL